MTTDLSPGLQRILARQPEVICRAIELRATLGDPTSDCPYCTPGAAGNHQPWCSNAPRVWDFSEPSPVTPVVRTGWLCPRCGKSLAPWVRECGCSLAARIYTPVNEQWV